MNIRDALYGVIWCDKQGFDLDKRQSTQRRLFWSEVKFDIEFAGPAQEVEVEVWE